MSKHCKSSSGKKVHLVPSRTVQLPLPVLGTLLDAKSAFFELCIETGRRVLMAMQEVDREVLCGPKGRHDAQRAAYRGGSTPSRVVLGGRAVDITRLRARGAEGELTLPSFRWAANRDPLNDYTLSVIAAGASMRRYERTLDPLPADVAQASVSKSAVSRRFVALSTRQLGEFLSRPLGELELRVVYIDGKVFQEHCLLIALGVQADGAKQVLGLREGATENARVVKALIADLVERGLPTERPLLFVIDGARALRKAIREVFGDYGVVQRCQFHKRCNILAHLPEQRHASVERTLREAYAADSVTLATRRLERLASSLERAHPGAAASLREGLEETLTVLRLGVSRALRVTLSTTNPIENLNSVVERYTKNVKRWRGGKMIERWVAAALLDAETRFRRVRGYRDLARLTAALDALADQPTEVAKVA